MTRVVLSDSFELPLPRRAAFRLFTARGERLWVPGWEPELFTESDDIEPGTVFRTRDAEGRATTWVVVDCAPGSRIRYARVFDGRSAGTVDVTLDDTDRGCRVTVAYDLTATDPDAGTALAEFESDYPSFIASWREEILAHLDAGGALPPSV